MCDLFIREQRVKYYDATVTLRDLFSANSEILIKF